MRVVLVGLTGMGNAALACLRRAGADVAAVVTDPIAGPGFPHYPCQDLIDFCQTQNVPIWTGVRLRDADAVARIVGTRPDVVVIATSPKVVPDALVQRMQGRVINCHPSLLPRHRGPTPISWTIECGDKETGLTYIQPTADLDAGPVWSQARVPVDPNETAGELRYRLDQVLLPATLPAVVQDVAAGRLTPRPQTGVATTEKRYQDTVPDIDWARMSATECLRRFRARTPWPGAHVTCAGRPARLTGLRGVGPVPAAPPGTVVANHLGSVTIDVVDGRLAGTVATAPS
jgi:methionyl-tRNA formyltransferase